MPKPFIFISCGQYATSEKELGKRISKMVKELTEFEPFFAEEVQDLNGLDANILTALHDCVAFITILHPRGVIDRPGNQPPLVRASVWIEQEIAIATYIQRVEGRKIPIIAFKHRSVGREGIRDLIQLNPIEFENESEILEALPGCLSQLGIRATPPIQVQLVSVRSGTQDEHSISKLRVFLVNNSNDRITQYVGEVQIPRGILKHWSSVYLNEIGSDNPSVRRFRFSEEGRGILNPHDKIQVYAEDYCARCGLSDATGLPALVAESGIEAKVWINGREYSDRKTIAQLADEPMHQ